MKIWLLLVLGPLLAIATTPSGYAGVWPTGRFSSLTVYAGPPLPVPLGSPHCRTYRPWVVSRWQEVPSKNFLPARYARLSVLHGAFLASSVTVKGLHCRRRTVRVVDFADKSGERIGCGDPRASR